MDEEQKELIGAVQACKVVLVHATRDGSMLFAMPGGVEVILNYIFRWAEVRYKGKEYRFMYTGDDMGFLHAFKDGRYRLDIQTDVESVCGEPVLLVTGFKLIGMDGKE